MSFQKITEQESLYHDLEKKSVHELLTEINQEDQKVALAVQKVIPQIEKLVTGIVERMKQGGRLFYLGADWAFWMLPKFHRLMECLIRM